MIYCCEKCGFLFERYGDVEQCPDCNSSRVRHADEQEQSDFKHRLMDADKLCNDNLT
jgi:uncharacterized Zn finger protein (UPF0148 family)